MKLKRRTMPEMICFVNQQISEMEMDNKDKIRILGMITAIYQRYEENVPKWIPCSERLPDANTRVYVTARHNELGVIAVDVMRYYSGTWECSGYATVLAWCPLPEPYKG